MGLDVSYFENARLVKAAPLEEEDEDRFTAGWNMPVFADRAADVPYGVYEASRVGSFRAGSYSGYNRWRAQLCDMAHGVPPSTVWAARPFKGAFAELIDFADNEGTIGTAVSAKLAKDFADNAERAEAYARCTLSEDEGEWFLARYADWRQAFEAASEGGFVKLH